ncbi:hypothetical protein [Pseudomonas anguilliseptica]|uniref:hypothetical protein n=1 Tax=Pseudomonas anguilliseptica TaxID=53406 RepID=UPI000B8215B4|nr:hypothetical protein [Pseudomonas anguilliseptica]
MPAFVTFHDLNPYTARHMQKYLQALPDVAEDVSLATDKQPLCAQRDTLQRAASRRALGTPLQYARLPGLWN